VLGHSFERVSKNAWLQARGNERVVAQEATPLVECRVRYLSFLGIGRDVRRCAFIVHTAQDLFVAHAFHAEPSSGALCKTIEAACKVTFYLTKLCLNYQYRSFTIKEK
jgi:hypothetical protein